MNEVIPFQYEARQVRVIQGNDGEPWWVMVDVCRVLDIERSHRVVERLDEDEVRKTPIIDSLGRNQDTYVINESGLYTLIVRSNKKEARKFRKWITSEVLPQIRKTGKYSIENGDSNPHPKLPLDAWAKTSPKIKSFLSALNLPRHQHNLKACELFQDQTGYDPAEFLGLSHAKSSTKKIEAESRLAEFFDDVRLLRQSGAINGYHIATRNHDTILYIWFIEICRICNRDRIRRKLRPFDPKEIREALKRQLYFARGHKTARMDTGHICKAIQLDLGEMPDDVKAAFIQS